MNPKRWLLRPRIAALIVTLLLAQSAALAHLDLNDSHDADGICALCAGLSGFSAANVSAVALSKVEPARESLGERSASIAPRLRLQQQHFARAPPPAF